MKIALVCARANYRIADMAAAMTRRGHRVSVYTRRTDPELQERTVTPQRFNLIRVPAGPPGEASDDVLLRSMGPFANYLDESWNADPPDIVHAHCWMSGIAAQLATRHLGLPAIQTLPDIGRVSGDRLHLEATVAKAASWVVATCADDVFRLRQLGRPRGSISVVATGVDEQVFTPEGPRAKKAAKHRVVSTGKLLPYNGFDEIVRAVPKLPHTELVIAGSGERSDLDTEPEVRRLRELADELGVARRVHVLEPVDRSDLPSLLRSADVVACGASLDTSGNAALEAMSCGVPVVAGAVGALLDTVVHDVTGYLVPPSEPVKLAHAINAMRHDEFLRQSLGAAGRDRVRARYTWDVVADDLLRVYDRAGARPARMKTLA